MRYTSISCPGCGATHQFLLSRDKDRHLRQCPECQGWFVAHDGTGEDPRTEGLDDPPRCPVDGCEETLPRDELPQHIIERHDGSLVPER